MVYLNRDNKKDKVISPAGQYALDLILAKNGDDSIARRCRQIAPKIGITSKYLYQIAYGHVTPGKSTTRKLKAAWEKMRKRPAYKRRLVISYDEDEADLFEEHKQLTNAERKAALNLYLSPCCPQS